MTQYFNPLRPIDLSSLGTPNIIEQLNFETIYERKKSDLLELMPESQRVNLEQALSLDSDPMAILLQQSAYDEMVLRQRINEAVRATMLAFASGEDLDHIGANRGVKRKLIQEADTTVNPPVEEIKESDDEFRTRIQMSPESFSVAGPYSAYLFHAISAHERIKDVSITRPKPGDVSLHILSRDGDGTANQSILDAVYSATNDEYVRPLNDTVLVRSSEIIKYSIDVTLTYYPGVQKQIAKNKASEDLLDYVNRNHKNGIDITHAGIIRAVKNDGVQNVSISSPPADIVVHPEEAAYCELITINDGGTDV